MDLMGLCMLGGIGRGFADNLQKCGGDTRVAWQLALHIDPHAHQTKGMDDIAQLLCRFGVTPAMQVGGNRAQQRIDLLE